jgi:disulfide bond formation protein DsbB
MDIPTLFTRVLAIVTVLEHIVFVLLLLSFIFVRPLYRMIMDILGKNATLLGVLLSSASTVGSLIYSEVVGFPACILCWTERIFMYPLMFLLGLGAIRHRKGEIYPYVLFLSLIGGAVSLYQWVKDMLALYSHVIIPCPAVTALPSCDKIYVLEYGYITIPMFALSAFLWISIVMYAGIITNYNDSHKK